jgi:hypothetical protein
MHELVMEIVRLKNEQQKISEKIEDLDQGWQSSLQIKNQD